MLIFFLFGKRWVEKFWLLFYLANFTIFATILRCFKTCELHISLFWRLRVNQFWLLSLKTNLFTIYKRTTTFTINTKNKISFSCNFTSLFSLLELTNTINSTNGRRLKLFFHAFVVTVTIYLSKICSALQNKHQFSIWYWITV